MSDAREGLELIIPAAKRPAVVLFLGAWLIGWLFGEISAVRQLFERGGPPGLFLIVWLVGWSIGGLWAAYSCLWCVVGSEVVSLRAGTLAIKYEVLGVGTTFRYQVQAVRHLRVLPDSGKALGRTTVFAPLGSGTGSVAFDYESEVVRFAAVGEGEARRIIAQLRARDAFPDGAA